jgi:hypothetical protein
VRTSTGVGNDLLRRLKNATTQARQRERRTHQLDKRATLYGRVKPFCLLRKLTRYKLTKYRAVSQLLDAAPISLATARRFIIL